MIGQLRSRLGLYVPQESLDDLGGSQTSWIFQQALWAAVTPQGASETRENGRLIVTQKYRVTIRYQDGFPLRAKLLWGDKHLRVIASSDPDNRRERLHLICEEVQQ